MQALHEQLTLALRDGQSLAIIDDAVPQLRNQREPARDYEIKQQRGLLLSGLLT